MFEVDHVQDGAGKVQQEAAGMAGTEPGRAVLMRGHPSRCGSWRGEGQSSAL